MCHVQVRASAYSRNSLIILVLELAPSTHSLEQARHPSHRFDHSHFLDQGCMFDLHHCLHAPEAVGGAVVSVLTATVVIRVVFAVTSTRDAVVRVTLEVVALRVVLKLAVLKTSVCEHEDIRFDGSDIVKAVHSFEM